MSAAARRREAGTFKTPAAIDARGISDPQNADEALAMFTLYAEAGDCLTLHGDFCRTHLSASEDCTCTPLVLAFGATA